MADLAAVDRGRAGGLAARLGLVSVGRLLAAVEPHRSRWALQHLPYEIAKAIGARIEPGGPKVLAARREGVGVVAACAAPSACSSARGGSTRWP